jgi:hypothetical protein
MITARSTLVDADLYFGFNISEWARANSPTLMGFRPVSLSTLLSAPHLFAVHQGTNLEIEGKRLFNGGPTGISGCACD